MKTLTTNEALIYIQQQTGKRGKPYHKSQLHRWRNYGWLERHSIGVEGNQSTYTMEALDKLIGLINVNYRMKRKP